MRPTAGAIATAALLALLAGGCGADEPSPGGEAGDGSDGALDGTVDGTDADQPVDGNGADDGASIDVTLDAAIDTAVADLAATEGVADADIEVVTAERVTWPDGALGCPQPGEVYTQALVPGYRIVLRVASTEYSYHGADGSDPSRCDDPEPPAQAGG